MMREVLEIEQSPALRELKAKLLEAREIAEKHDLVLLCLYHDWESAVSGRVARATDMQALLLMSMTAEKLNRDRKERRND